jgi:hypothetical protein
VCLSFDVVVGIVTKETCVRGRANISVGSRCLEAVLDAVNHEVKLAMNMTSRAKNDDKLLCSSARDICYQVPAST